MRQFLIPASPQDGLVSVSGRDYRYLVQVLRLKSGDRFDGRLPDGTLCSLDVRTIDSKKKTVLLAVGDASVGDQPLPGANMPPPQLPDTFPPIILFQWLLKGQKMDTVIRQCTETGVAVIVPVAGARSVITGRNDGHREERWNRIIREARQQSGSPVPTTVHPVIVPEKVPGTMVALAGERKFSAFLCTEAPLALKSLHQYLVDGAAAVALVNGPEGGLTAGETDLLVKAGFSPIHFQTNILRAETCALYGIAAVQNALTELETWRFKD